MSKLGKTGVELEIHAMRGIMRLFGKLPTAARTRVMEMVTQHLSEASDTAEPAEPASEGF